MKEKPDNKNYEIVRLNENLMKLHKNNILDLMKELTPNCEESYYHAKTDDMESFVIDGSAIIFVAIAQQTVVGYIWGYVRGSRIHVTQFVVGENYRNIGIGKELMQQINTWTREHGFLGVELNVLAQNHGGIRFYQRNGFTCKNLFMVKSFEQGEKSANR